MKTIQETYSIALAIQTDWKNKKISTLTAITNLLHLKTISISELQNGLEIIINELRKK